MIGLFRWLRQHLCSHRYSVEPTGRRGSLLAQGRCRRCGSLFLVNLQTGGCIRWTPACDRFADDNDWPAARAELPEARWRP